MAIEGLGNTYGIPLIKKERDPDMNKKNEKRKKNKEEKKEKEKGKHGETGNIDIRI